MKKAYISSRTGELILPKKFRDKSPLTIRAFDSTIVYYHKKGELWEAHVFYPNRKNNVKKGFVKINGELYKVELKKK